MRRPSILWLIVTSLILVSCSTGSPSSQAPETTAPSAPDPTAFATGLSLFFAQTQDAGPAPLAPDLAACTRASLRQSDGETVAAIRTFTDGTDLSEQVGTRVIRAAVICNRTWMAPVIVRDLPFGSLGIDTSEQQDCVTDTELDGIAGFDDETAGTGESTLQSLDAAALDACVPIGQSVEAILRNARPGTPATTIECMARATVGKVTWKMLLQDPATVQSILTDVARGCVPRGT